MNQIRRGRKRPSGFRVWFGIFMVMMLVIGGCGGSDEATQGSQSTRSDETVTPKAETPTPAPSEPTITPTEPALSVEATRVAPDGSATDREALVEGLNRFALELYQAVTAENDENLIYSPASISLAFSMVYVGARGETEAQMADVLGFLPQEEHHPAANALDQHLASLGKDAPAAGEQQGEPFRLNIANAVWGQQDYPFEQAFLDTLAAHYGAGVRLADFVAAAEAAREEINAWVEERTEGRIADVVPEGAITEATRLVLANAIYFNAAWLFPFEESTTAEGSFTLIDGNQVSVPMMHHAAARIDYADGDGYQAALLPYSGGSVEMVVIVPEGGRFEEIESSLNSEFLGQLNAVAEAHDVAVTMPRFDFESELDLAAILPAMGMPDVFGAADFSGIAPDSDLSISAAIHKATIAVDESGTEATAATMIAIPSSEVKVAQLAMDRPFIFAIVERETGAILFLGRVMNPAG